MPTETATPLSRRVDNESLTKGDCDRTHPGFDVTCRNCGAVHVYVHSDFGWSETSGCWGGVSLVCASCDHKTHIWGD